MYDKSYWRFRLIKSKKYLKSFKNAFYKYLFFVRICVYLIGGYL